MRQLSDRFLHQLQQGILKPFLHLVHRDQTLCLEIREDAINIYYRGGNLARIAHENGVFTASFDRNYLDQQATRVPHLPSILNDEASVEGWLAAVPHLKHEMDLWFGAHPRLEREYQQLVVKENNFAGPANATDYYICDLEYAMAGICRFDMIAVHWPSSAAARKNGAGLGLAFLEMKYTDQALTGRAGLRDHFAQFGKSLVQTDLAGLKEEMRTVFNQKLALGLIRGKHQILSFNDDKPEYILILANHDPASSVLLRELDALDIPDDFPAVPKVAVANFMGYGLFDQCVLGLEEFKRRYRERIYAGRSR